MDRASMIGGSYSLPKGGTLNVSSSAPEVRSRRYRHRFSPDLPAGDRLAVGLGLAGRSSRRLAVFHDDRWGLRHARGIPADGSEKPTSPSQPDLVRRVVE